jgi:hypothetical protein
MGQIQGQAWFVRTVEILRRLNSKTKKPNWWHLLLGLYKVFAEEGVGSEKWSSHASRRWRSGLAKSSTSKIQLELRTYKHPSDDCKHTDILSIAQCDDIECLPTYAVLRCFLLDLTHDLHPRIATASFNEQYNHHLLAQSSPSSITQMPILIKSFHSYSSNFSVGLIAHASVQPVCDCSTNTFPIRDDFSVNPSYRNTPRVGSIRVICTWRILEVQFCCHSWTGRYSDLLCLTSCEYPVFRLPKMKFRDGELIESRQAIVEYLL